jgi:uncharacterized protein (DUF2336 family)
MSHPIPKNPIINEIESALRAGSDEKRIKVLMSVTDLFVGGAARHTESETKVFDDVMGHLIKHVESRALVELSRRLAPIPNAPIGTIQSLARNDAIEVSGPILTASKQLSDNDLVEIAKTKSQAHLASIARRPQLNEAVTDVLVDRGNANIANEVAINSGARLSKLTMEKLVMRADGDDRLTGSVSRRADIPPSIFRNLTIQATETVRAQLMASATPEQTEMIKQVMDELAAQIGKKPSASRNYAEAHRTVSIFSQDTDLTRMKILQFANAGRITEMIAALSVLSGVPPDQIDRLFQASNGFGLIVLCKSIGLEWNTAYAVIMARLDEMESETLPHDGLHEQYNELSALSAQQLLHFWLGRQKMAQNFRQAANVGALRE